jgi:hypothetical protein
MHDQARQCRLMLKRVESTPHARVSFALWFAALFALLPEPRCADYASVRAKPLAKPKRYDPLTPEVELELIRAYHEDGDLDALERLVGAHRPMVVSMAKNMWRGDIKLKALVEYGMLGLRIAAEPPRPSLTKKGKMAGFDVSRGARFGTFARREARKQMLAAIGGYVPPSLKPDFEHKTTATVEEWHRARMVVTPRVSPMMVEIFNFLLSRSGLPEKCQRPIALCSLGEPEPRKIHGRNYLAERITARELANKDLYYRGCYLTLAAYERVAKDTDWRSDDVPDLLDPAVEREGNKFNRGPGQFDKYGRTLPDYDAGFGGKVTIKRHRPFTPFLCQAPLASIYSLRRQMRQYVILLAAGLYINTQRRFENDQASQ